MDGWYKRRAKKIPGSTSIALSLRNACNTEYTGAIMGIKPSYIKTIGNELFKKQREYFSDSFDANKQQLAVSAVIPSKRVRNRIAGYITRRVNSKKRQ